MVLSEVEQDARPSRHRVVRRFPAPTQACSSALPKLAPTEARAYLRQSGNLTRVRAALVLAARSARPSHDRAFASRDTRRAWWRAPTIHTKLKSQESRCSTAMAKRNYLVEGLSGTGKSAVYEELIRRGYKAVSTDRAWSYHADPGTGLRGGPARHDNWVWDQEKAVRELAARNRKCCSSAAAAGIATSSCAISPRCSTSASTMTPCVTVSKSAPTTTGRLAKRESNSCSS